MRDEQVLYFLSDEAYEHLIDLAKEQGYIKPKAKSSKGLSDFIHDLVTLPNIHYSDNRPDYMRSYHEASIRFGMAPDWKCPGVPRRTRCLRFYPTTKAHLLKIAKEFKIIGTYISGRASIAKPDLTIGYVLEGLGLGWILPDALPLKKVKEKYASS